MNKKTVKNIVNSFMSGNKAILIIILLGAVLALLTPTFLTTRNLLNVLRQVCVSTITAVGFSMILGSGSIDLSLGSMVAFTGVCMANLLKIGIPILPTILIALLIGACIGMINSLIITTFKLPPFIVTLAMQYVIRGVTYLITSMLPVTDLPENFVWLGQGNLFGIPVPVYIMLFSVLIGWIIINRTKLGCYFLAIGGNSQAAFVSGINVKRVNMSVFIVNAMFAVIAAVVLTARSASAQPAAGQTMEMDAIAAAVIGGTSMDGGRVNIVGAFFGALIVGIVNNGLNLLGVDSNWQTVSKGLLILIAVVLDQSSRMFFKKNIKKPSKLSA